MSKKIIGLISMGAFALAALSVAGPASAESPRSAWVAMSEDAQAQEGVDRIAMTAVEIDTQAKTFSFKTSERFDGNLEHVFVKWTGNDAGFDYAVTSLRRHPELFHVFRLYNWKNGKADCKYYYHTAG